MRFTIAALLACSTLAAAGCGQSEAPKTPPPPAPKADVKPAANTKAEEKPHAPESHGMPGMSDLFKTDDEKKKEEKK